MADTNASPPEPDDVPDWYCPVCLGEEWHQFPEDCPNGGQRPKPH